jgi:uncharacterized oligopeptide transporter (OPT) family protein
MTERELTVRAIATGMVLGSILAPCNIYAGLKIGWAFNMSVAALLLGFAGWSAAARAGAPRWTRLESNINQTAASSAAAIAGAGLVAPIPALAMITGLELPPIALTGWVFFVSLVGVAAAVGLRRQLLADRSLSFPSGVATAEAMQQLYASGREAAARVRLMLSAGGLSGIIKALGLGRLVLPGGPGSLGNAGSVTWANLGIALDPSLLLVGFGAIIGLRAAASILLGSVLAWLVCGPWVLSAGYVSPGEAAHDPWFGTMVEWLLWPGVAMMVTASLTSFLLPFFRRGGTDRSSPRVRHVRPPTLSTGAWSLGRGALTAVGAGLQWGLFGIPPWTGALAVLLSLALAVVAGRVAGETGITPIGAMGKVSQLSFALVSPAQVTTNLMAANVAGGAASQCADMLHDLRTGQIIGADPRRQAWAQGCGVAAGAVAGSWAYLTLIPEPAAMLLTPEWPAPAVATWKAVAEVFRDGLEALPPMAVPMAAVGGGTGIALQLLDHFLPRRYGRILPSPAGIGLAFVLPAWNGLSLFAGAAVAALVVRAKPGWASLVVVAAAGLVAGESLVGVGQAFIALVD